MTGTYPWRNNKAKILTGANLIIDTTEMTLPKMFKSMGLQHWNCWQVAHWSWQ